MSDMPLHGGVPPVREYFTGLASLYSAHRPGYPDDAIRWIVGSLPRAARAADIGCGTGISSRLLAAASVRVVGIDPNRDMLREAQRRTPPEAGIAYCAGAGEMLPLRDGSVDLILCAQAFHWFATSEALGEFYRILAPAGALVLMWNTYDHGDPFTGGYARIVARARAAAAARGRVASTERDGDPTLGGFFRSPVRRQFANPQPLNWEGLIGRARSASYWPRAGDPAGELEADVRRVFDAHQEDGRATLRHWTDVTMVSPARPRPS